MAIAASGGSQSQVSALETAKWCQAVMPAGESNLDVLVAFDGPAMSERNFGVLFHLEDLSGCAVDLISEKGLRPELRPFIEKEGVHV